jgi:hypothetical protein
VAKNFLIPARADVRAQRLTPEKFKMLIPDWEFVQKNQTLIVSRFRTQIIEQIIQKR